jgi:hypothetical protein
MINSTGIKSEFSSFSEEQFWIYGLLDYPAHAKNVLKILLPFPTTYECEVEFSTLLQLKTKYRNKLNAEDYLRGALSTTNPRINNFAAVKQSKPFH